MMDAREFWTSGMGINCITPGGKARPEGEGFDEFLKSLIGDDYILEFGCGIGRLAGLFKPTNYVGVDISRDAVFAARDAHPSHPFKIIDHNSRLPYADVLLAHTVMLHIDDLELPVIIDRFQTKRIIISEVMGRKWRRDGNPPVFNREPGDYEKAFAPRYSLSRMIQRPYPHYQNTDLTVLEFHKC